MKKQLNTWLLVGIGYFIVSIAYFKKDIFISRMTFIVSIIYLLNAYKEYRTKD